MSQKLNPAYCGIEAQPKKLTQFTLVAMAQGTEDDWPKNSAKNFFITTKYIKRPIKILSVHKGRKFYWLSNAQIATF